MKKITISTLLFFPLLLIAQNWSPILVNEKMNYQHSDSAYISHTIWVDSTSISGEDSLFYLNRIVKDVQGNPEIALRNQPQYLKEIMIKEIYGIYSFIYPGQYWLFTLSNVGASWTFDLVNDIEAEITDKVYEEVFGVMDSIKIISIADGNEIHLSKNFGILKFPDYENGGSFELVGIQDSEYGLSIPDFWDIFNYNIDDVFQYKTDYTTISGYGEIIRKITIDTKELNQNSCTYFVSGIFQHSFLGLWGAHFVKSGTIIDSITFTDSTNHLTNSNPLQLCQLPGSESGYGTNKVFTVSRINYAINSSIICKNFGTKDNSNLPFENNVFYDLNQNSDTIYRFENISTITENPCGTMGISYGVSIGERYFSEGCNYATSIIKELVGYIKDGDTIGTISSDSQLLSTKEHESVCDDKIQVFPNPASDILNISLINEDFGINAVFELRNVQGKTILYKELAQKEEIINVSNLSNGLYFYLVLQENKKLQSGKILIKK